MRTTLRSKQPVVYFSAGTENRESFITVNYGSDTVGSARLFSSNLRPGHAINNTGSLKDFFTKKSQVVPYQQAVFGEQDFNHQSEIPEANSEFKMFLKTIKSQVGNHMPHASRNNNFKRYCVDDPHEIDEQYFQVIKNLEKLNFSEQRDYLTKYLIELDINIFSLLAELEKYKPSLAEKIKSQYQENKKLISNKILQLEQAIPEEVSHQRSILDISGLQLAYNNINSAYKDALIAGRNLDASHAKLTSRCDFSPSLVKASVNPEDNTSLQRPHCNVINNRHHEIIKAILNLPPDQHEHVAFSYWRLINSREMLGQRKQVDSNLSRSKTVQQSIAFIDNELLKFCLKHALFPDLMIHNFPNTTINNALN